MSSSTFRKCLEKRTYNNSTPHSMKIEELEEIYEDLEKVFPFSWGFIYHRDAQRNRNELFKSMKI